MYFSFRLSADIPLHLIAQSPAGAYKVGWQPSRTAYGKLPPLLEHLGIVKKGNGVPNNSAHGGGFGRKEEKNLTPFVRR